jgi:hypothetical protein
MKTLRPWSWVLIGALCLLRLPAVVQPLGPDQAIYAYVGQTILDGGLPYRDAWDQKPPGLHAAYAVMWWLWPNEAVVPLTDAVLAWLVALLLWRIAPRFGATRATGALAAGLFLLLGDPAFSRLAGVRVRGQGEVFIGALITLALLCILRAVEASNGGRRSSSALAVASGIFLGLASIVKYQAGIYLVPLMAAVVVSNDSRDRRACTARLVSWSLAGFLAPAAVTVVVFATGGAVRELWDATVLYNIRYAGETYSSVWAFLAYLLSFPVQHARVDALWLLGGAGSAILLFRSPGRRILWIPLAWTAAACLSIAVNGSRSLPQYFLQAFPPLALSASLAADVFRPLSRTRRGLAILIVALAAARVVSFPEAFKATAWDTARLAGRIERTTYLARFAGRPGDKYSAPDTAELGAWLRDRSSSSDSVYIFGFSSGAYVYSGRRSASRFFWSMPVINRFNEGRPGYGPTGLLVDLRDRRPRLVALQRDDFGPGRQPDSRAWFLLQPELRAWLAGNYRPAGLLNRYELWERLD